MTVIELGDLTSGSPPRTAREFDARTLRRAAAALVVVACLLTLTGSVRPGPTLVRTLYTVPMADDYRFAAGAGMLVATTEPGRLAGYDLATGHRRWTFPMPEPNSWPTLAAGAGVVLLSTDRVANQFLGVDGNQYLAEYYRGTIGLDLRDGRRLWQSDGTELARNADGTVLLVDYVGDGTTIQGYRVVRARDGAVLWSGPPGPANTVPLVLAAAGADPRRPDRVVAVAPDGSTTVYAWADGRVLTRGKVLWQPAGPGDGRFTEVFADGLNVYVRHADGFGGSLEAYALTDLRRRWTARNAAQRGATACGPVVCVFDRGTFAAYDPVSGQPRWRQSGLQGADRLGDDTLLLVDAGQDYWAGYDALTGRVRARFGLGFPVRDDDTEQVVLTLPTVDPPMRTSISRVDPDTGERSLRGTVARVGELGCVLTGEHLVCSTVDQRLSVSRIAP